MGDLLWAISAPGHDHALTRFKAERCFTPGPGDPEPVPPVLVPTWMLVACLRAQHAIFRALSEESASSIVGQVGRLAASPSGGSARSAHLVVLAGMRKQGPAGLVGGSGKRAEAALLGHLALAPLNLPKCQDRGRDLGACAGMPPAQCRPGSTPGKGYSPSRRPA